MLIRSSDIQSIDVDAVYPGRNTPYKQESSKETKPRPPSVNLLCNVTPEAWPKASLILPGRHQNERNSIMGGSSFLTGISVSAPYPSALIPPTPLVAHGSIRSSNSSYFQNFNSINCHFPLKWSRQLSIKDKSLSHLLEGGNFAVQSARFQQ